MYLTNKDEQVIAKCIMEIKVFGTVSEAVEKELIKLYTKLTLEKQETNKKSWARIKKKRELDKNYARGTATSQPGKKRGRPRKNLQTNGDKDNG